MLLSQFTIEDFFNDLKENKSIALFVGTGLDSTDVYPRGYYEGEKIGDLRITWSSLLKELIKNACISGMEEKALGGFSSDLKAALLKQKLEGGYIPIIQEWLYKRCNKTILEDSYQQYDQYRKGLCAINNVPFYPLFVIAESILLQHSIRAVVTQNYDNFLSETIKILLDHNQDNRYPYRVINPIEIYDGWM